ncbi:hypothetical protein HK096_011614 [Nowakowskiella sp. JEL0078]|nr:hypothetical protein HK096_011614 [Nowakowskiella sp. JEL0078]
MNNVTEGLWNPNERGRNYNSFNNAAPEEAVRAEAYLRKFPPVTHEGPSEADKVYIRANGFQSFKFQSLDESWVRVSNNVIEFKGPIVGADACVLSLKPLLRLDHNRIDLTGKVGDKLDYKACVYYEVTIKEMSFNPLTVISVGFATANYPPFRLVGWNKYSIGIHSDDGRVFENDKFGGRTFTGPFSAGQTVGCGYDPKSGRVFFTLNGVNIGEASKNPARHPYHACVGADGKAKLSVNFGEFPFVFKF